MEITVREIPAEQLVGFLSLLFLFLFPFFSYRFLFSSPLGAGDRTGFHRHDEEEPAVYKGQLRSVKMAARGGDAAATWRTYRCKFRGWEIMAISGRRGGLIESASGFNRDFARRNAFNFIKRRSRMINSRETG